MEAIKRLPNLPLPSYSGDLLDRALLELEHRNWDIDAALKAMRGLSKADFGIVDWSPAEVSAFEDGIQAYGHELWMVAKKVWEPTCCGCVLAGDFNKASSYVS